MDTQHDNFQKDMYQVPAQPGAILDDAPVSLNESVSDAQVDQTFEDIAREETNRHFASIESQDILSDFNKITEDLEMSLLGQTVLEKVELVSPHPVASQLLQIGDGVEIKRNDFHEHLLEEKKKKRLMIFSWVLSTLFINNRVKTPEPTIESILEHESKSGVRIFPDDPEVKEVKFFYLRDQNVQKWYHMQESAVQAKHFTNSYSVNMFGIDKSSTFYDPRTAKTVNVSVPVGDEEAQNLLVAAKNYYEEVTGKVYVKTAAPRHRFGSKNNRDPAA